MAKTKIAVIQTHFSEHRQENVDRASEFVHSAAKDGAQVVLLPELFETQYFCREKNSQFFEMARPAHDHPTINHFQALAEKLKIVIPLSFFEKDGEDYFNSLAFIDETGKVQGIYRKTFIPGGPGYEEKFYFKPGNTGFKVWATPFGRIGTGICWDQWFPEAARAMVLKGADILLYPSCIGSEPEAPEFDTKDLWQRVMIGHTVANVVPVAAANRVGIEGGQTYYGSSFIADHRGNIVTEADRKSETILIAEFDFAEVQEARKDFALIDDLKDLVERQPQ